MDAFCDVTLSVEGKTIEAHQKVLRKASPFFARNFDQFNPRNKEPVLSMEDFGGFWTYEIVLAVIKFIYTGVKSWQDLPESSKFNKVLRDLEIDPSYQIFVNIGPSKKNITLDVHSSDTILSIKERVHEKGGIPVEHQRIIFAG